MKSVIIVIFILAESIVAINAQIFVEGGLGVAFGSTKYSNDGVTRSNTSNLFFSISPKVGYWLNDHIALGIAASFNQNISKRTENDTNTEQEIEYTQFLPDWSFSVFGRYKLWGTEKLSLFIDNTVGIGGGSSKEKTALITEKKSTSSSFFIRVYPVISYDLTDKFIFIATSNLISLGYQYSKTIFESSGNLYTSSSFGFSAEPTNSLNLGIIYNF